MRCGQSIDLVGAGGALGIEADFELVGAGDLHRRLRRRAGSLFLGGLGPGLDLAPLLVARIDLVAAAVALVGESRLEAPTLGIGIVAGRLVVALERGDGGLQPVHQLCLLLHVALMRHFHVADVLAQRRLVGCGDRLGVLDVEAQAGDDTVAIADRLGIADLQRLDVVEQGADAASSAWR